MHFTIESVPAQGSPAAAVVLGNSIESHAPRTCSRKCAADKSFRVVNRNRVDGTIQPIIGQRKPVGPIESGDMIQLHQRIPRRQKVSAHIEVKAFWRKYAHRSTKPISGQCIPRAIESRNPLERDASCICLQETTTHIQVTSPDCQRIHHAVQPIIRQRRPIRPVKLGNPIQVGHSPILCLRKITTHVQGVVIDRQGKHMETQAPFWQCRPARPIKLGDILQTQACITGIDEFSTDIQHIIPQRHCAHRAKQSRLGQAGPTVRRRRTIHPRQHRSPFRVKCHVPTLQINRPIHAARHIQRPIGF